MNPTVEKALNDHVNRELYAAYLYLSMAAWCESASLPRFAHWMRVQNREEVIHAMKFFDHLTDRGGRVRLQSLTEPPADFESPLDLFDQVLRHEQEVSVAIHELYELSLAEKDYPSQPLLQWFITEQVEEERMASQVADQLRMAGEEGTALILLDRELGARADAGGG
ncbi:MAG: ferritin [Actinobacteria bacterium]|nr:ferritin [Actinomycetota bacterium]